MQESFTQQAAAARSIPSEKIGKPKVGLILGSGLGSFVESVDGTDIPYTEIREFPIPTVEGHAGFLRIAPS